jgi:hypothetical protein
MRRDEETIWARRAKVKYVQDLIAKGKHKKKIFHVEQDGGTIVGEDNLKFYITKYYKKLFGEPSHNSFSLMEDRIEHIPQLSTEENAILTADFTENEVLQAISQIKLNKAPGPDGLPAKFYQTFWNISKSDLNLMAMFAQLQSAELSLFKLNFGVITLPPKKESAVHIQQY